VCGSHYPASFSGRSSLERGGIVNRQWTRNSLHYMTVVSEQDSSGHFVFPVDVRYTSIRKRVKLEFRLATPISAGTQKCTSAHYCRSLIRLYGDSRDLNSFTASLYLQ
jgi:hypothetical protein